MERDGHEEELTTSDRIPDSLLHRAATGDSGAREQLWELVYPRLRSMAHGRLPAHLRRLEETEDLVQQAATRVFTRVPQFEEKGIPEFLGYLRTTIRNVLKDELRRYWDERPVSILGTEPSSTPSPEDLAVENEVDETYERALEELKARHPRLFVAQLLRTELELGYPEIADLLGKPSAEAARVDVGRARKALGEILGRVA